MQLKDVMTPGAEVIAPEASIYEAAEKMSHHDVSGCVNMLENWPFENAGCALGSRRCENAALQDE